MSSHKKFWITLGSFVLGMALIACSCSSLNNIISTVNNLVATQSVNTQSVNTNKYSSLPYYDDFSDSSSGWDVYSSDTVDKGYRDGYYFLSSKTTEYTEDAYANKLFKDTIIEVDASPVSGIGQTYFEYGLSCRVQSNYFDGYDFSITTDGYYAVYKVTDEGDTYTSLLQGDEYQESSAILQGYQTNHIKVTCNGSQLNFEVNGVVLFEGQESTFQDGDIRFSTTIDEAINNEIHFDNFGVTAP